MRGLGPARDASAVGLVAVVAAVVVAVAHVLLADASLVAACELIVSTLVVGYEGGKVNDYDDSDDENDDDNDDDDNEDDN